jgi:hypothetical protein
MKNNKIFNQLILVCILSLMSCTSENKTDQAVSDLLPFFVKEMNEEAKFYSSKKSIIDSIKDQKTSFYDLYDDYSKRDESILIKLKSIVGSRVYDSLFIESIKLQKIENKLTREIKEYKEQNRKALLIKVKNYLKSNEITKDDEINSILKHLNKQLSDEVAYIEFPLRYDDSDDILFVNVRRFY